MPNYLERVVTSGARTTPTVRPPVSIAPPLPLLQRPAMPIETPVDAALENVQRTAVSAPTRPEPDVPPAGDETIGVAPPVTRSRPVQSPAPAATPRHTAGPLSAAPADALLRPGREETIVRAPRGLRGDAMLPIQPPEIVSAGSVSAASPAESAELAPPLHSSVPPARDSRPAPRHDGVAPALEAADQTVARALASAAAGLVGLSQPVRIDAEAAIPARSQADIEVEVSPALASAPASPSSHAVTSEMSTRREPPAAGAVSPAPSAWPLPARPPAMSAPVVPRAHAREPRITIGRIDVEVHNETPPAPPARAHARVEAAGPSARVASRFLLKP